MEGFYEIFMEVSPPKFDTLLSLVHQTNNQSKHLPIPYFCTKEELQFPKEAKVNKIYVRKTFMATS